MNLVLHGLFLQVIVSIVQFQHDSTLCSAGEPGYLDFDNLPETNFSCQGKVIGGYYADVEAGCQMFHVCTIGQKDEIMDIKFLCLNGTVFDQETRVCERVDEVDCSKSERFYNLNLELYGNNAVTLSLHDTNADDEDDPTDLIDDTHELQRTTSTRPTTTSTTTTTTKRPIISSTTSASGSYQRPSGYPQHYQPQPRFPSVQTSQSKSLYDDKNGGYHHQYIYHTGDHRTNNLDNNNDPNNNNNNQNRNSNNNNDEATSYQIFNNQGVGSTTGSPQIHQIHYSSTPGPQIQIRNDHQPTISPIFHATSSTIQTLLNSNANSPALINPIFHSHGIASTTEQFNVHNNNPRETDEYRDDGEDNDEDDGDSDDSHNERRPLQAIQPTAQGKVSKLKLSSTAVQQESIRNLQQNKQLATASEQQRLTTTFLPSSNNNGEAVRSFYPTPRTSTKSSSSHVTQHIHVPPPPTIPQLKPHQVTINLSPPDIQRIAQNPSPLLPSQSRVIVTAKASVSDESGRPLNSTQLVTLPLPTIPASYDDYKEGDESFDPFYRDVPKIRNNRKASGRFRWPATELRDTRSARKKRGLTIDKIEEIRTDGELETPPDNGNVQVMGIQLMDEAYDNEELPGAVENSTTNSPGQQIQTDAEVKTSQKDNGNDREIDREKYVDLTDTRSKSVIGSGGIDSEDSADSSDHTFDSKIFDDPEARTSKEVDTRAVDHDSKYSKDHSNHFDNDGKQSGKKHTKALESTGNVVNDESSRFSIELPEVIDSLRSKQKHSSERLESEENEEEEDGEEEIRDAAEAEGKEADQEGKVSEEEYSNEDYYFDSEMNSSSSQSNEGEESAEYSTDSPNTINASRHHKSLDDEKVYPRDRSMDEESFHRREKNGNSEEEGEEEDYDVSGASSTARNSDEVISSEMSSEYGGGDQISKEDSREMQDEEENISIHRDHKTSSKETNHDDNREVTGSTETNVHPEDSESTEDSEGVLKFTDEIPTAEVMDKTAEVGKPSSGGETSQDYIDDNYEPQSYKEKKDYPTTTETGVTEVLEEVTTMPAENEKEEEVDEVSVAESTSTMESLENTEKPEEKLNDEPQLENQSGNEGQMEMSINKPSEVEEVTSASSTTTTSTTAVPTTTTSTTMLPTTSMTTTTTSTTTTTTTTARPTPPKLFKPFTLRKNYVYVPPSTTPVPVIIKPRLTLLNPKPAKPLKSYNDYAPKPIIRKSLFTRKIPPTLRTTASYDEGSDTSTGVPKISTTISNTDESVSGTSKIENQTEIPESPTTTIASVSTTEIDENLRAEKNDVPVTTQMTETLSATQQTFTPYPLLKMTEIFSTSQKAPAHEEKRTEQEITTRTIDVQNNDVPSFKESGNVSAAPETSTVMESSTSSSSEPLENKQERAPFLQIEPTSDSTILQNNVAVNEPRSDFKSYPKIEQTVAGLTTEQPALTTALIDPVENEAATLTSVHTLNRKPGMIKRIASFNCLEKEMYRFYSDGRDCRLFHYCSPGFTSRQVLDFRFVCEEGTAFDEKSQSCVHDLKNPKCRKRVW